VQYAPDPRKCGGTSGACNSSRAISGRAHTSVQKGGHVQNVCSMACPGRIQMWRTHTCGVQVEQSHARLTSGAVGGCSNCTASPACPLTTCPSDTMPHTHTHTGKNHTTPAVWCACVRISVHIALSPTHCFFLLSHPNLPAPTVLRWLAAEPCSSSAIAARAGPNTLKMPGPPRCACCNSPAQPAAEQNPVLPCQTLPGAAGGPPASHLGGGRT
jgi:hypothetical protein